MLIFIALGVACGLSGDYCFKTDRHLLTGFLLYAASGVPVWQSYRVGSWMQVAFYWGIAAIVVSAIMGVCLFHETLTVRQWIAFGLAIGAVWLWNS